MTNMMNMTIPGRNIEIAIARAYYEAEVEHAANTINTITAWDNMPIVERVRRSNMINYLIIAGIITPGPKVSNS
jgi:hypothetical protein